MSDERKTANCVVLRVCYDLIYPDKKKETQHLELINSQKDHKRWTSFVYIGSKVCQLLLHYISFATRGGQTCVKKNGHKPSECQIVTSHKISVFINSLLLDEFKQWESSQ